MTDDLKNVELVEALEAVIDAFLLLYGCFPVDRATAAQRQYSDAMKLAYKVIGQPDTEDRKQKKAALTAQTALEPVALLRECREALKTIAQATKIADTQELINDPEFDAQEFASQALARIDQLTKGEG